MVPGSVQFSWLGHTYIDVDGDIIRDRTSTSAGVVAGRMDYEAGLAFLTDWLVTTPQARCSCKACGPRASSGRPPACSFARLQRP